MGAPHKPVVEIEEITSVLTPAPGVSLDQALKDAKLTGYKTLEKHGDHAVITWYKRGS